MIEVESALALIHRHIVQPGIESKPLGDTVGRLLASTIRANRRGPPYDRVAMDGMAVNIGSSPLECYSLEGIQRAGEGPKTLTSPRAALEVMTGAMLPLGANTVIPYECFSRRGSRAYLSKGYRPKSGANIHREGSDHDKGDILLESHTRITPAAVALMAGQGLTETSVFSLPPAALVSTGDELVEPGKPCEKWQIWRSNTYGIHAELRRLGYGEGDIVHRSVGDDRESMLKTLSPLLENHSLIILSGGVSAGKYDFIPGVLKELGVVEIFHKVKQRPGKPLYFGLGPGGENIFGLPGNPVSALICMRRYVSTAIEGSLVPGEYPTASLSEDIPFEKDFSLFCPVKTLLTRGSTLKAHPLSLNGSGDFAGLGKSDGFLQLPSHKSLYKKGETYPYFTWIPPC